MQKVQSTCNFCAIDCNLDFYVEDGRIVRTVPTKGPSTTVSAASRAFR